MRHVPALVKRELSSYFLRPMAYFVLLGFQVIAMLDYFQLVELLSEPRAVLSFSGQLNPMNYYVAGSWMFWVALLIAVPALTMRLIAEERRTGTIEGLMTVPVTETEVVLGKWIAGVVMYLALLVPFAIYLPFLKQVGGYELDPEPLISLAVGLTTMGMMFMSIGVAFSAATRNQVEAAVGTFVVLLAMLLITVLNQVVPEWAEAVSFLSVYVQLSEFAAGRLDLRVVALHLSVTVFALFLAVKVLEARRES
ncbi:ABC transporter permease [Tautonia rosea]|uniref:ABC transporter permease n=1 Tax=Tautonia rosea TaxID=2728037 RepID=UPI001474EC19|nr:ABC transporter permease subunit [Tautonia rosea]